MSETTYSQRYASGDSNTAGAFAFDTISAKDYAVSKLAFGAVGSVTYVSASDPLPITAASLPLPTGAATSAKQDTQTTHLATIAGAVSGTEVQVDVVTMPTVTVQDGGGSITVDGTVGVSGTVAISAASLPLPSGAATAAKQPAIGTAGTASADVITVQGITSMTALKVDGSAVTQPVSGTVSASQSGTWTVQPGNTANTTAWLVTGTGGTFPVTDNAGSLTVDAPVGTPVFVRLSDGSSAISTLPVSLASVPSHAVTNAGTFAVQAAQSGTWNIGTVTTVTTCATVTTLTGGGVAHDSADSGNPVKVGGRAIAGLSGATLVAAADRSDLLTGTDGALLVRGTPLEDIVSGVASITDGSSTSVIAAQGAGVKVYVTDVTIANTSATAVTVDILDGAAGSVKWTFPAPANTSGVTHRFGSPLPFSANTAVCADPSAAASTVTVSIGGFRSKV